MKLSIIGTPEFATAARSFLEGLVYDSDLQVVNAASTAMGFAAGKVFSLTQALEACGELDTFCEDELATLSFKLGRYGAGHLELKALRRTLDEDHLVNLDVWISEHLPRRLQVYDFNNEVLIEGFERRKPHAIRMSLSEGQGLFGAMFTFTQEATTPEELAVRSARMICGEGWKKQWLKGFEEIPA